MKSSNLLFVIAILGATGSAQAQAQSASFPEFTWSRSLPVDSQSPAIQEIGGTEARSLVSMGGKLYAGIGYWSDSKKKNPRLPGAQVLVLDSPTSQWRVDLQLDDPIERGPNKGIKTYMAISALNAVTFHSDMNGKAIAPTSVLLAGVWRRDREGGSEVFYRVEQANSWKRSVVSPAGSSEKQARSFFLYIDKKTGLERVFIGNGVPDGNQPGGIWSAVFDSERQELRWNPAPEQWAEHPDTGATVAKIRVASFAECKDKLYAAAYDALYERQDGAEPIWKKVFQHPLASSNVKGGTGFRGLTMITDPVTQKQVLLVAQEARPFVILKIHPLDGFRFETDLNISRFLGQRWNTVVGYGIAAYNDMVVYPDDDGSHAQALLIGFEAILPKQPSGPFKKQEGGAHFLVRHSDGTYELRDIVDHNAQPPPFLVSTRALIPSPFADDPNGTLYASGFDANSVLVHNTAWIYKGIPVAGPRLRDKAAQRP